MSCTQFINSRTRKTIDSNPYNTWTEHVGFPPARQTLLVPSAKRREVFGDSHEECAVRILLKKRLLGGLRNLVRMLQTDDSSE